MPTETLLQGYGPSRSRYNGLLGVNHFIMRVQWPSLPHANVLRTITTLGEIFA